MKKFVRMMMSVVLTLMLVLSVLPIGAFAAENDEEVTLESVEEIVEVNAGCSHFYEMQFISTYKYSDQENHRVEELVLHQCVHCYDSYTVTKGTALQAHSYTTHGSSYRHFSQDGVRYHTLYSDRYCNLCKQSYSIGIVTEVCYCGG